MSPAKSATLPVVLSALSPTQAPPSLGAICICRILDRPSPQSSCCLRLWTAGLQAPLACRTYSLIDIDQRREPIKLCLHYPNVSSVICWLRINDPALS